MRLDGIHRKEHKGHKDFLYLTSLQKGLFIAEAAEYAEQYQRKSLRSLRSLR